MTSFKVQNDINSHTKFSKIIQQCHSHRKTANSNIISALFCVLYLIPLSKCHSFTLTCLIHPFRGAGSERERHRRNTGDKVQQGNKKPPSSPSEMRTVRGNDPFTAIQQLHPSPNILSITHLSKSHMKQREGRWWKNIFCSTENRPERLRRNSSEKRVTGEKSEENLLEALMVRVVTCLYFFLLCSDWSFLSIPWHIHSPLSSFPSSGNDSVLSPSLPFQPLCLQLCLPLPACPMQVFSSL